VKVACGGRRGPLLPNFHETATAGRPEDLGDLATAVCVTLLTRQKTTTALDGDVAEA